jgi:hypothetical protein
MTSETKGFSLYVLLATGLSWVTLFILLFFASPTTHVTSVLLFYALLFLCLCLSITWIEVTLRKRIWVMPIPLVKKQAIRHGLLISLLVIIFLVLQSQNLLSWWLACSLLLLSIAIEAIFNL